MGMNTWKPEDIKSLRASFKLSQRKLGELLGVSGNYIYLLEKGMKTPSMTLRLLLDFVSEKLAQERR